MTVPGTVPKRCRVFLFIDTNEVVHEVFLIASRKMLYAVIMNGLEVKKYIIPGVKV